MTEKKSIIWEAIGKVPLTIREYASFLKRLTENANPSETAQTIEPEVRWIHLHQTLEDK